MANPKLNVAIFDNDLKCRPIKKYEISDNGTQIRIKSGGTEHFMPTFDNNSFLEIPTRKKFLLFGDRIYKRIYFVKNKGEKCVNFHTGEVKGPNPEQSKEAIGASLLKQVGQVALRIPTSIYVLLIANLLMSLVMMKVLGVF